jgi:tRNA pseudouridine55 synthase
MNGVLVADKPLGPTSHDVVARVRRALGLRRVGHTGTLDPLATGVLPLVVGRATRLAALLSGAAKEYVAHVRFGAATPTYDADSRTIRDPVTGAPVALAPPPPEPAGLTRAAVEAAVDQFRGTHWQVPPAYSAKKIDGVAAYKRARRNESMVPRPVSVTVHALDVEGYEAGLARIRLSTSAGFYVRSFAHELGQQLGCGGHLEALRRHRAGDFTLADAVPLETVEREGQDAVSHLIPLERLLLHLPAIVLTERGARRASHGNALVADDLTAGQQEIGAKGPQRLLDGSGALLGIAEPLENGALHPVIVLV